MKCMFCRPLNEKIVEIVRKQRYGVCLDKYSILYYLFKIKNTFLLEYVPIQDFCLNLEFQIVVININD